MTITTEEAERLATVYGGFWGLKDVATALRSHTAERDALQRRVRKLEYLVQCLLDEDPNDLAADGGVTVLDVWRKEARAALEGEKKDGQG